VAAERYAAKSGVVIMYWDGRIRSYAFAPSNLDERMGKTSRKKPVKRTDAEIVIKRNYGISSVFSDTGFGLYEGIAVFANRRGYRFLSAYFRWLAERAIAEADWDPGDHDHLTPHSCLCDEIDFTFDTLTPSNRKAVLRNAGAKKRSRRRGSPIKQFTELVAEIVDFLQGGLKDDQFRHSTINEINQLIDVLEKKRAQLERM